MAYEESTKTATEGQSKEVRSATWLGEVEAAEKNQEKWREQGRRIVKRFLDKRDVNAESSNKINLFTTNTQILISTLYAKFPKPMVTREFEDPNDQVARAAAMIMERNLAVRTRDDFDVAMRYCVQDRLVPGVSTVWFRYEPTMGKEIAPAVTLPDGTELSPATEVEVVVNEKVVCDYVFWEDLLWSPARTWEEVRWIGRRVRMSKSDATGRFGAQIAERLNYTEGAKGAGAGRDGDGEKPEHDKVRYAVVYEIWCKKSRCVYWVSKGFDFFLDKREDPLQIPSFWPCPRFLMALTSTSNLMPRPDYLLAQDQYQELDEVNNRITMLERAIKVVGIYDGTNPEVERIFSEGMDNKIIPTRSFAEFAEKGGFKGAMDWLPIEAIVNALEKLRVVRQDLMQQIYEITGLSDIMRGATRASETARAQELKAQYGSVRLQFLQMEVATFVQEALAIKAEIIRKWFAPETMLRLANVQHTYDAQVAEAAVALLKSDDYEYRIEVHADSMAVPEFNAERDGRMMYVRAVAEMMQSAGQITQSEPSAIIPILEIIKWAATSFRSGRTIEPVLDQAIKMAQQKAQQPPPNGDDGKAQAEIQKLQADNALAQQKLQADNMIAQQKLQAQIEAEMQKFQAAQRAAELDRDLEIQKAQIKAQTELQVAQIKEQAAADTETARVTSESRAETASAEAETAMADILKQLTEVVQTLAESANAPKRVVRSSDGTVIGIEPVTNVH